MLRVRVAGVLAAAVSAMLLVVVLVRDVGLNPLNGWTIVLGLVAAALLLRGREARAVVAACVALVAGMAPALFGGFGLLYLPPLLLAATGALRAAEPPGVRL